MKKIVLIISVLLSTACGAPGSTTGSVGSSTGGTSAMEGPGYQPNNTDSCMTVCPAGAPGLPGVNGLNGSSCSVTQVGDNATVNCTDGTSATLEGGTPGPMGATGLTGATGAVGPMGPMGPAGASIVGPAGPIGPQGLKGDAGVVDKNTIYQVADNTSINSTSGTAFCQPNDVVLSGGCLQASGGNYSIVTSYPLQNANLDWGWGCRWSSSGAGARATFAICLDVTP